jgi:hypothetical protein
LSALATRHCALLCESRDWLHERRLVTLHYTAKSVVYHLELLLTRYNMETETLG